MKLLQVVLQRAHPREVPAAERAVKWLQLHVDALGVVFQVRDGLESLAAVLVGAFVRADAALDMGQHVALQVLLLLEGFFAALVGAREPPVVALQVPVELTLADELLVWAPWALELQLLARELLVLCVVV